MTFLSFVIIIQLFQPIAGYFPTTSKHVGFRNRVGKSMKYANFLIIVILKHSRFDQMFTLFNAFVCPRVATIDQQSVYCLINSRLLHYAKMIFISIYLPLRINPFQYESKVATSTFYLSFLPSSIAFSRPKNTNSAKHIDHTSSFVNCYTATPIDRIFCSASIYSFIPVQ